MRHKGLIRKRPVQQAKVVEEPGPSVKSCLVKSNVFPRKSCGRLMCPWLARRESCMERCYTEGYTVGRCRRCREKQLEDGVLEKNVVDEV